MTADDLRVASLATIESLYASAPVGPMPRGVFDGHMLHYLNRGPMARALDGLLFDALPYGIDFDRQRWWFVRPALCIGRFDIDSGSSAWRATQTLRLTYDGSRLPRPVRAMLYDEIKPLDDDLCLGLGGVKGQSGSGDHFFFFLTKSFGS